MVVWRRDGDCWMERARGGVVTAVVKTHVVVACNGDGGVFMLINC